MSITNKCTLENNRKAPFLYINILKPSPDKLIIYDLDREIVEGWKFIIREYKYYNLFAIVCYNFKTVYSLILLERKT